MINNNNDTSRLDAGTSLVRSGRGHTSRDGSGPTPWKDGAFEVTKNVDYKPNTVLAFAPCDASWHAVKEYHHPTPRDSIQVGGQSHGGSNPNTKKLTPCLKEAQTLTQRSSNPNSSKFKLYCQEAQTSSQSSSNPNSKTLKTLKRRSSNPISKNFN
jgi:hypothetical protein